MSYIQATLWYAVEKSNAYLLCNANVDRVYTKPKRVTYKNALKVRRYVKNKTTDKRNTKVIRTELQDQTSKSFKKDVKKNLGPETGCHF